ncbi:MAG TPA: FliH/SctL family protein, partial [Burkholderiaceae bacterium]|nr:FliH/SctL family protein [Burkholderiaceae bacterium]
AVAAWHPPDLAVVPAAEPAGMDPSPDESARQAAWLEGHAAAMAERDASVADAGAALQAAQRALRETTQQVHSRVASTVYALAVAIAQHLIERELAQDPSVVQQLVARALILAPMHGVVTVRVHPDDLAALHALGGLPSVSDTGVDLRWTPDQTLVRGSCVVEGPSTLIDGRIDRALLDIYERISHD